MGMVTQIGAYFFLDSGDPRFGSSCPSSAKAPPLPPGTTTAVMAAAAAAKITALLLLTLLSGFVVAETEPGVVEEALIGTYNLFGLLLVDMAMEEASVAMVRDDAIAASFLSLI